mmetsp:Transcript_2660/g.3849  ORF Transcript_2660/g.3849 Transcript_2660/m.3849 type:complete len:212 (+) Transcript_2660:1369-2004(+)
MINLFMRKRLIIPQAQLSSVQTIRFWLLETQLEICTIMMWLMENYLPKLSQPKSTGERLKQSALVLMENSSRQLVLRKGFTSPSSKVKGGILRMRSAGSTTRLLSQQWSSLQMEKCSPLDLWMSLSLSGKILSTSKLVKGKLLPSHTLVVSLSLNGCQKNSWLPWVVTTASRRGRSKSISFWREKDLKCNTLFAYLCLVLITLRNISLQRN